MDYYFQSKVLKKLEQSRKFSRDILQEMRRMSREMDALIVEVQNTVGVEESVLVLLDSLAASLQTALDQLATSGVDLTAIQTITTDLATERQKLADKVAANPAGSNPIVAANKKQFPKQTGRTAV
jgi:hypothetical protein